MEDRFVALQAELNKKHPDLKKIQELVDNLRHAYYFIHR